MISDNDNSAGDPTKLFLQHLENTGFFKQVTHLEASLKSIVDEIESFSAVTEQRQEESENVAAHILAIEAVLTTVMKKYPITEPELLSEIHGQAMALTGKTESNPTVEAVAIDLLRKSRIERS